MSAPDRPGERLVAIDWMRGFVMVLMAIDHGSAVMNGGRLAHDSVWDLTRMGVHPPGGALDAAQFFTRWITHLCAPTFLFLSGTSLALSTAKRERAGESPASVDRHLVVRGLVLLGLEVAWMSLVMSAGMGHYAAILQVLWAIGLSLIGMAFLRHLRDGPLVALALGWFVLGEAATFALAPPPGGGALAPLFAPQTWPYVAVLYPVTPWLAMMMLGWAFGSQLVTRRRTGAGASPAALCALWGAASLVVFAGIRGWNGYGNMRLLRRDDSLWEWLHVSKYPPSLSYTSLELGIMALVLAGLFWWERRRPQAGRWNPILVLGQTALFFYLLHIHLIGIAGAWLGRIGTGSLPETYAAGLGVVVLLYPACLWYRGYKARHPRGWPQYI